MFSPEVIAELSNEAAAKAAQRKLIPYTPWDSREVDGYPPFPFPNLGSYRPKGWELVDHWLVDKSGFGREDEPALTPRQLKERIYQGLEHDYGYAIIEEGQFQVVLGVFREIEKGSE